MYTLSRVRPPLTLISAPLTALFYHRLKQGDVEQTSYVKAYRNSMGDSRSELYDEGLENPATGMVLWSAADKILSMVSFGSRQLVKMWNPMAPSENDWLPGDDLRFIEKPRERKLIYQIPCHLISLETITLQQEKPLRDECWVSFELGLVVLDIVESPGYSFRWEMVDVRREEPTVSFKFDTPEDFTVIS